jgi:RNA polymerase sigma factor (sigma-70 family)
MEPAPHADRLGSWFERDSEYLYCWLRARLGPSLRRGFDVEDLLQEVLMRATLVLRKDPARPPTSNSRGWLLGIARNIVFEALRSSFRRSRSLVGGDDGAELEVPDTVTSLTRRIARSEERQRFFAELDGLEEHERQLLVQHGLEGRPLTEVAVRLGISVDAAHKRWQRLRDRLRELGSPADLL